MIYRAKTSERWPERGPKVAMYAVGKQPTSIPKKAHKDASVKLSKNTAGPSIPNVMLLAARLMLNQRIVICVYPRSLEE